jgi:hypothetical protein
VILRTIEQKIESLVEGVFGRAFKTSLQPVELARKLTKEMDENRTVSVSRVYVPNEYSVYVSTADREHFASYEASLKLELQEYLAKHARREGYVMLSPPTVLITTDDDLSLGEFGIATRMAQPRRRDGQEEAPPEREPAKTMVHRPPPEPDPEAPVVPVETVSLIDGDRRYEITRVKTVLGRSQGCDIRLNDPNVSRRHAEIRQEDASYWIVDLESTNGVEVNGERVQRAQLEDGDTVSLGESKFVFSRELS